MGLYITDMDGDNDLDVVASSHRANKVVWYEAPTWKWHIIDSNLDSARELRIADMDGDNDLDVVAAGYLANDIVWYENALK